MSANEKIIEFKLQRAKDLFAEVSVMMQNKFYNTAVNRIYYACYHATLALLLTKNLTPKTHSGASKQLHQYFVSKDNFDKRHSQFYSALMQERLDSDYGDFLVMSKDETEKLIQPAKEYIDYISSLLT